VSDFFEQAAEAKAEQRARLHAALTAAPDSEAEPTARELLLELLGEDELARVDEQLLALVTTDETASAEPAEPEPGPGFFTAVAARQETQRHAFMNALLGRRAPDEPRPERDEQRRFVKGGSFDGGSRTPPPPPPPSHEQTLGELFRTKAADVGRRL
jgi:hypothetical protein